MAEIHEMTEGDANTVAQSLARIMKMANDMAETGNPQGFRIYKTARDALEIMAFDRVSRDALAKLSSGRETFQGWIVTDLVMGYMRNNQKINAIKEFRGESGMGLKEAKDWVEAYMKEKGMDRPF